MSGEEEQEPVQENSIDVSTPEGALKALAVWAGEKEMNRQLGILRETAIATLNLLVIKDKDREGEDR